MSPRAAARVCVIFVAVVLLTGGLSWLRGLAQPGRDEAPAPPRELVVRDGMTLGAFARENALDRPVIRQVFGLSDASQLENPLSDYGLSADELSSRVLRAVALQDEGASKDWGRIRIKFALWIVLLAGVFVMFRRGLIRSRLRVALYALSVLIFGVLLGADPSPMGTVKDAIALYGKSGVIFRPRMIALAGFLLMVLLANKFICAWGCQFGVLQDLLLRLRIRVTGSGPTWKPPFAVTNSIRALFFVLIVLFAFLWSFDIVEPVDPFKIYKPAALVVPGILFIVVILAASLFVYRPWCHLFCPFGLVGWVVEKLSIFRIKVDYGTCIACEACARACPSTVMRAILRRDRAIPDCFACGACTEVCPVGAVRLGVGRRSRPPSGKFATPAKSTEA